MKTLLLVLMFAGSANAAVGQLVYSDVAASSAAVSIVTLSSGTPVLMSPGPTTTQIEGNLPISWYSLTLFNQSTSSAAYTFAASSFTAPGLTCANGVPVSVGTEASPFVLPVKFFGFYMWGVSCKGSGGFDIKVERKGR